MVNAAFVLNPLMEKYKKNSYFKEIVRVKYSEYHIKIALFYPTIEGSLVYHPFLTRISLGKNWEQSLGLCTVLGLCAA